MMRFTQLQAREALGLSVETLRHWRKVLPYLNVRQGRQAHLSFGDLVALAALRCLVDELELSIGQFAESGREFFEGCNRFTWIESTGSYALIRPKEEMPRPKPRREPVPVTVSIVCDDLAGAITRATVVAPLDPFANALRISLFGATETSSQQPRLPLPPTGVPTDRLRA